MNVCVEMCDVRIAYNNNVHALINVVLNAHKYHRVVNKISRGAHENNAVKKYTRNKG